MKNIFFISTLIGLLSTTLHAQQLPLSSLYNVNRFQLNSAYAGFTNCTEGYLSHRSQWVGLGGAPKTNYLSIQSRLFENMGLGANISIDQTDIISRFSASFSYAYRIKLGTDHNLRLGLSLGMYQVSTNVSNAIVDDETDQIVSGGDQSSMAFQNDFSVYYNFKKLEIGVSIPQIVETKAQFNLNNATGGFKLSRHIVTYVGYDFTLNDKLSLVPSILYKTVNGRQSQLDVNAQLNYNKLFFVGAGYRTNAGFLARLGLTLKEMVVIAYAYEFTNGNVSSYSGGSHEIMIGINLCRKKTKQVEVAPIVVPVVLDTVPEPIKDTVKVEEVEEVKVDTVPVIAPEKIFNVAGANEEFDQPENSIRYEENGSENSISANEKRLVNKVVEVLTNNPDLKVVVTGHTCDIGSSAGNKALSEKRAKRVEKLIVVAGVDPTRVSSIGKGEDAPRVPNTSEANRVENRRVQLSFTK